jgi:hypothetical protein
MKENVEVIMPTVSKLDNILIQDKELEKMLSYWSCDACGGDSDSGCQMSDPDNCVRG